MNDIDRVRNVLRDALQLGARADTLVEQSPLLGAIPELDSMAVVNVITMIEDEFGIVVEDEDVSADMFETIGSLTAYVARKANR